MCIDYLVRSVPPCANIDLLAFMIDMPRSPYAPNFVPCMYVANSHVYGMRWNCGICPSVGVVGGSRKGLMTWHTRRLDNFASHLRGKRLMRRVGDLFEGVARGGSYLMFLFGCSSYRYLGIVLGVSVHDGAMNGCMTMLIASLYFGVYRDVPWCFILK